MTKPSQRRKLAVGLVMAVALTGLVPGAAKEVPAQSHSQASDSQKKRARAHFRRATRYKQAGDAHAEGGRYGAARAAYGTAAEEFMRAFRAYPHPGFVYNAAQMRRLRGDLQEALWAYERFLQLNPEGEKSAEARTHIAHLQRTLGLPAARKRASDNGAGTNAGTGASPDSNVGRAQPQHPNAGTVAPDGNAASNSTLSNLRPTGDLNRATAATELPADGNSAQIHQGTGQGQGHGHGQGQDQDQDQSSPDAAAPKSDLAASAPARHPDRSDPAQARKHGFRLAGLATAAGGLFALGLGGAFGLSAHDAERALTTSRTRWEPRDRELVTAGERDQRRMLVALGIGTVAVLAGTMLYGLGWQDSAEPDQRLTLTPHLHAAPSIAGDDLHIGLSASGRF